MLNVYMRIGILVPMAAAALDVLEVIAEPTRRRILDHVREHERSVNELVALTGMHQPGVSRHLRVLRDAGLVDVRVDAQLLIFSYQIFLVLLVLSCLKMRDAHYTAPALYSEK